MNNVIKNKIKHKQTGRSDISDYFELKSKKSLFSLDFSLRTREKCKYFPFLINFIIDMNGIHLNWILRFGIQFILAENFRKSRNGNYKR